MNISVYLLLFYKLILFKIKKRKKLKINKYKNSKYFKSVLKFVSNFILRSIHSLHIVSYFYPVLLKIKLIWFSVFYLSIYICRNF